MSNSRLWPMEITIGRTPADDLEDCFSFQVITRLTPAELFADNGKLARQQIEELPGCLMLPANCMVLEVNPIDPTYEEDLPTTNYVVRFDCSLELHGQFDSSRTVKELRDMAPADLIQLANEDEGMLEELSTLKLKDLTIVRAVVEVNNPSV